MAPPVGPDRDAGAASSQALTATFSTSADELVGGPAAAGVVDGTGLPREEARAGGGAELASTLTGRPRGTRLSDGIICHGPGTALARLAQFDRAAVRLMSNCARPRPIRVSAMVFSRLGNGGIYAVLSICILVRLGKGAFGVIAIAICNAALLHAFYPALKRRIGRPRPCKIDGGPPSLLEVLDEHSFPSGHVMTLAAALVPMVYVDPGVAPAGTGLLVAMAWARVASGHHYPSDVIAGALLALATGYPLTVIWFSRH